MRLIFPSAIALPGHVRKRLVKLLLVMPYVPDNTTQLQLFSQSPFSFRFFCIICSLHRTEMFVIVHSSFLLVPKTCFHISASFLTSDPSYIRCTFTLHIFSIKFNPGQIRSHSAELVSISLIHLLTVLSLKYGSFAVAG